MTIHELKSINPYFTDVWNDKKKFEIRKNDRNFQIGDLVLLKEYDLAKNEYSGRKIPLEIIYILNNYNNIIKKGYVIFSFKLLSKMEF